MVVYCGMLYNTTSHAVSVSDFSCKCVLYCMPHDIIYNVSDYLNSNIVQATEQLVHCDLVAGWSLFLHFGKGSLLPSSSLSSPIHSCLPIKVSPLEKFSKKIISLHWNRFVPKLLKRSSLTPKLYSKLMISSLLPGNITTVFSVAKLQPIRCENYN